jgi:hypothetical protein
LLNFRNSQITATATTSSSSSDTTR